MSQKTPIKIAAIQDAPVFMNLEATVEKTCTLIKEAAEAGASCVLFPESFISAYPDWVWTVPPSNKKMINELYADFYNSSVSIPDKTTEQLCQAARESSIFVIIGINEKNKNASNSSLYNSMLYIDSEGKILGVHRKLMPTGGERLMWAQGGGANLVSFETSFGKIGGLICWENFMPLARFAMYSSGVQIYFAPTWDSSDQWLTAMKHIAREGGMFVISCAQAIKKDDIPDNYEFKSLYPADREWINKGNSCIANPKGQIIAGPILAEKTILYAELDLSEISNEKWLFDVAGHYNREDVFDFKVKP